jgi:signal peptidase I
MSLIVESGNNPGQLDAPTGIATSGASPVQPRDDAPSAGRIPPQPQDSFFQAFQSLLYVIVVALFITTFTVQPFRIPSLSMEPTLLVGDFLLADKQIGREVPPRIFAPNGEIRRGDLIVFHYPIDPSRHLVKRVIGLPGDRLKLRDGHVFIDGRQLSEPYASYQPTPPDPYRDDFPRTSAADPDVDYQWWVRMRSLISGGELTVPPASYFVLGDNRNESKDSRYWGFVPSAAIVGKPLLVYFSLNAPTPLPDQAAPAASVPGASADQGQPRSSANSFLSFARWSRTFRVLR